MGKLLIFQFWVTNSKLKKKKKIHFDLVTRSWKTSFTSSLVKLLFSHFRVKKKILRVTNPEMKKPKFWFRIIGTWDFFIEMKYYTIQNYLKKMQACWIWHVILDIDLALNIKKYCSWSWDYSANALYYPTVFFEIYFCN